MNPLEKETVREIKLHIIKTHVKKLYVCTFNKGTWTIDQLTTVFFSLNKFTLATGMGLHP